MRNDAYASTDIATDRTVPRTPHGKPEPVRHSAATRQIRSVQNRTPFLLVFRVELPPRHPRPEGWERLALSLPDRAPPGGRSPV